MYRQQDNSNFDFVLGLLAGAVVGAGLAALFAPKPGREFRGDIARSAETLRAAAADRYSSMASRAGDEIARVRHAVAEAGATNPDDVVDPLRASGPLNTATFRL